MYSKSSVYLTIIVAFLASAILSSQYISKYDRLKTSDKGYHDHVMIKSPIANHWKEADELLKDIKSGKSYFTSGKEHYDEFLPARLLALYYYITGYEIIDSNKNFKINNGKLPYLIIKTFLYYLTLFYLCKKILTMFPIKNCFFTILFLAFEPTIFQYHSSFWNESLFFSFEILLLSLLLDQSRNILKNIFIGFILGIMFTISQEIFFYIIPLLFYYFILFKKKSIKPVLSLVIGYVIIFIIIGLHNYKRVGEPHVYASGIRTALYIYLAPQVLAKKSDSSIVQVRKKMRKQSEMWIEKNNIDVTLGTQDFSGIVAGSIKDKKKYYDYLQKTALKIIITNPFISVQYIFKQSLHMLTLNPVYIKYFYQFEESGDEYNKNQTHKKWIPVRIIYSVILYLVIFWGMINSLKYMKKEIIFFIYFFWQRNSCNFKF